MCGLAYFALRGRHMLVRSPEEDFAIQNKPTQGGA
jgi:hypothetical protein